MFKKRGSFKVGPGVRVNWGRMSGFTSVNVGGVRIGGARRSRSSRADALAREWRLKPGIWHVRFHMEDGDAIDLVVNGGEVTFDRMRRLMDAQYAPTAESLARTFKTFVLGWDLLEEDGQKRAPITARTVERVGREAVLGMAVSIANVLEIPRQPLSNVLISRSSGKPINVSVSSKPFPPVSSVPRDQILRPSESHALPTAPSSKLKSVPVALLFWLILGIVGGHRYYLGRNGTAFLMTITLGGAGIWWLFDLFLLSSLVKDANNRSF